MSFEENSVIKMKTKAKIAKKEYIAKIRKMCGKASRVLSFNPSNPFSSEDLPKRIENFIS